MIVVIGSPIGRLTGGTISAGGTASRVALEAAAAGRSVQLVGKAGDDATGERVVLDLARRGVGHVALLRDPAHPTPLEAVPDDDELDEAADESGGERSGLVRTPMTGPTLDAADVDLGLRYLTDFAVVVLADSASPEIARIAAEAARWGEARLVLVVGPGEPMPDGLPPDVIVFEAPADDPDGVFATLVGTFAAALDDGTDPGAAFQASIANDGWTDVPDDGSPAIP